MFFQIREDADGGVAVAGPSEPGRAIPGMLTVKCGAWCPAMHHLSGTVGKHVVPSASLSADTQPGVLPPGFLPREAGD